MRDSKGASALSSSFVEAASPSINTRRPHRVYASLNLLKRIKGDLLKDELIGR